MTAPMTDPTGPGRNPAWNPVQGTEARDPLSKLYGSAAVETSTAALGPAEIG